MISVENVSKHYGQQVALDQVSFQVEKGEILGFLGPNGAGKTTAMRILTGYMPPTDGVVTVGGHDVFRDSLEARRIIGYLPETVPLYREMEVDQYLDFVASIRGVSDRPKAIDRVLEACDIGDMRGRLIAKLSKGYRQRVGLAQALVHDPEVLVLDEPTIGLDPRQILGVRDLIKGLGGERTVILSTHILPEVSHVCQRVLIINHGRIVAEDTPETLTSSLQGGMRVRLELAESDETTADVLMGVDGVTAVEVGEGNRYEVICDSGADHRRDLAELAVNRGWGLLEMSAVAMSLEEIFLELTTDEESEVDDEGELVEMLEDEVA